MDGYAVAMSARDRILDSFEAILSTNGERSATLDAVAAHAGVSKGGLLYHFPNRDALTSGLLERLNMLADVDVAAMSSAPEGPSIYYVSTSCIVGSAFDRALVAATRLGMEKHPDARSTIRSIQERWLRLIRTEVGDDGTAAAIMLLGDGMYYNAAFGGAGMPPGSRDMDALLKVVGQMMASAGD